ncbi:TPA: hypothetical protein U1153_001826 [Streptococcus suis]|nr:hypothetical protein [Streptococcus suis]
MAFKFKSTKGGYTTQLANKIINPNQPIYSLSTELEPQQRFEDKKPTGEIIAYKAWFVQEGQDPFQVKFEESIKLPTFLSLIQFDNLQACEVKYNIYFRANGIKEVR